MIDAPGGHGVAAVSRETRVRLDILADAVRRWQPTINLVSISTLPQLEIRHIADSLQLVGLAPPDGAWLDLGSGGGFPGLVIAASDPTRSVHLVESDQRKCAFLRQAARAMDVAAEVHEGRIEPVLAVFDHPVAVVSARALARLDRLIAYSQPLLARGAVGLFPKGRGLADELTLAHESWRFDAEIVPSRTDPDGGIIRITGFHGPRPRAGDPPRGRP